MDDRKGSKLSRWFHDWIESSTLDPEQKAFLHQWGMLFLWAGMILGGIVLLFMGGAFLAR